MIISDAGTSIITYSNDDDDNNITRTCSKENGKRNKEKKNKTKSKQNNNKNGKITTKKHGVLICILLDTQSCDVRYRSYSRSFSKKYLITEDNLS